MTQRVDRKAEQALQSQAQAATELPAVAPGMLFIATTLSIGYSVSTLAQNRLQPVQMALMLVAMTVAVRRLRQTLD